MARKKGRDVSGWLIVDKPAGVTSTSVVNKVRWALDARKAGHAGTLDPDATGVLAVALGEATKTVAILTDALKCYDFVVNWGAETATDDASGQVVRRSETRPDRAAIEAALPGYVGEIMQVPPAFSAVKVDGARAYDLAREGEDPDLAARPLWVESLSLIEADGDTARLEMVCGKGGYVRSIARDLGRDLGCLGHVASLRRTWSGPFEVEDGMSFDGIDREAQDRIQARLLPLEAALTDLPALRATPEGAIRIRNGNPGEVTGGAEWGELVWVADARGPVCIGRYQGGTVQPERVFNL
ncbi:MAG: tRNA pseudouridine(55) synthase TruB [Paracoccus sp. (in: a-proteobacteria)]|uniref:tRNA pseudouridine(55) synthase TruB n=1 Tax=unclassified Paracoccus (in: a-proteobacteria) TaxID=2688777 RepID=UPI00236EEC20|nr:MULTISPECIES: tRNA pseudouridine(55) synthase TruB [unclassified Paracoccus (in: a-proteobacteria)]MCS5603538.1 tRNA pseudouridine(55) synthase TruB [Paracoccus sp. (in: a-proteobacteria)]MDB2551528.1 tRNA pseudouridine(55) synthase TruB [Paracoccus sp. (in: a-proteobacteria)]|tara:strand:+ start:2813 stop:3706 length:894 start_codon:yes stop_codon:yes gene_type:complete